MPRQPVPHDRLPAAGDAARPTAQQSAVQDLRASVDRLDRLSERGAALDELAEELRELERAVACLVGSHPRRPLSAVLAVRSPGDAAGPAPRPTGEWTTTGVLR